jgi:lipopolysaccharide transport system permease protein
MERTDESMGAVLHPNPQQPAAGADDLPETVNDARGGGLGGLLELWQYRDLLVILAWRDIKVRYKQTFLGIAWAVLQPVAFMVVFYLVLGRLSPGASDSEKIPYPIFVFAGLLPWLFFASAVGNVANSVVASEALVSKVYFPRLIVPLASVGSSLADFVVSLAVLGLLMACYGIVPPWPAVLLAPAVFVVIVLVALGVGTFLAALNVTYRDFRYVVPFLLQLWMFATPAIYVQPKSAADEDVPAAVSVLDYNPINPAVAAFRAATLGGDIPWRPLGVVTGLALAVACAGFYYFRRAEDTFADVI